MTLVYEAVENGVGERGLPEIGVPGVHGKLAGDERGAGVEAVIEDLQQVGAILSGQRGESPVIDLCGAPRKSMILRFSPIGPRERNDLLELLDDRVGSRASILTSRLPIEHWHEYLNDPTLADAIMDRLIHCSHKIHLHGKESMRERTSKKAVKG